jgi:hypothetical protein
MEQIDFCEFRKDVFTDAEMAGKFGETRENLPEKHRSLATMALLPPFVKAAEPGMSS